MMLTGLFPRLPTVHGTFYAYTEGCRCDDCRAAAAQHKREYRQRQQARQQELAQQQENASA